MQKLGTIVNRARAIKSFVTLVRDPGRLDQVFEVAERGIHPEFFRELVAYFGKDPAGRRALRDRPRVRIDLSRLAALPDGTFGRAVLDHLTKNKLDPGALPTLEASDPESFVRAHLYETHDIWHAATGFDADPVGEIGLQAFYLAQFPAKLASMLLAAGFLHVGIYRIEWKDALVDEVVRGWEMGRRARPFFGVDWEKMWERPLDEVRRELGVTGADAGVARAA
jgi:ubiquinone biosynthesis protein Coq4